MKKDEHCGVKEIFGAVLGAIIFSLPWVLVYVFLNYILSILAFITAIGSLKFYKLFGGKVNKKTGIVITCSSIFAISLATFVFIPILYIYKEANVIDFNYFFYIYSKDLFLSAIIKDYVISILFTFLGISGVIKSINFEAYKVTSDLVDVSLLDFDDKVSYIYKIYEKYNAFDKKSAIPKSILLEELNVADKFNFVNYMIKSGVIISRFNKTYFDKDILKDENKCKKNAKKRNIKIILLSIVISLFVIILMFLPTILTSKDNDSNSTHNTKDIKDKSYVYKNISIVLPETFKKYEENEDDISYLNYGQGEVYQVILSEVNLELDDEKINYYQDGYYKSLENDFNILEQNDIQISNLSGKSYFIRSINFQDEYYVSNILFGRDRIYIIMYFTRMEEKDDYSYKINEFKKQIKIYNNTVLFNEKEKEQF